MARGEDAENALTRLNNSIVDGRTISINFANPKKPSNLKEAEFRLNQTELEVQRLAGI